MPVIAEELLRKLPDIPDVWARIASGEYTVHGGVVRYAAGTGKGGQIVGHLIYPAGTEQAQQSLQQLHSAVKTGIDSLQGSVGQLQQSMNVLQGLQVANLALSGLNLAVSVAGFAVVCHKLKKISAQIEQQSQGIVATLQIVNEARARTLLDDEARFRALILTAGRFFADRDIDQLKNLILPFNNEYQFTRLVLEHHSTNAVSNVTHYNEITTLQDRLVHLGLMLSHVQIRTGGAEYGQRCLVDLSDDLTRFNRQRIAALSSDLNVAAQITPEHFTKVTSFLQHGKAIVPALDYQSDIIGLEIAHPGVLQQAEGADEILLLAA